MKVKELNNGRLAMVLTHSLTRLLTYSLTHSLTHLLTYSLTHALTHLQLAVAGVVAQELVTNKSIF